MRSLLWESQTTNSTVIQTLDSLNGMESSQVSLLPSTYNLLQQYRIFKANGNINIKEVEDKEYFPQFCTFFTGESSKNILGVSECRCNCLRTEDNYC
jgi:hypothetical protein